jgi:hypothetical protein
MWKTVTTSDAMSKRAAAEGGKAAKVARPTTFELGVVNCYDATVICIRVTKLPTQWTPGGEATIYSACGPTTYYNKALMVHGEYDRKAEELQVLAGVILAEISIDTSHESYHPLIRAAEAYLAEFRVGEDFVDTEDMKPDMTLIFPYDSQK